MFQFNQFFLHVHKKEALDDSIRKKFCFSLVFKVCPIKTIGFILSQPGAFLLAQPFIIDVVKESSAGGMGRLYLVRALILIIRTPKKSRL